METDDEQAIERYRYMLRTAPPETLEQAHQEAFERLTPEQRRMVLKQLSAELPPGEHPPSAVHDDPQALARMATRAEIRQPGILERLFGGMGGGGMGGGLGGSLLTSLAGSFVGNMIADHFFNRTSAGQAFYGGGFAPEPVSASTSDDNSDDNDDDDSDSSGDDNDGSSDSDDGGGSDDSGSDDSGSDDSGSDYV